MSELILRIRFFVTALLLAGVLSALLFISSCRPKQEQKTEKPPVPVTAGVVLQKDVPLQISVIGTVEPSVTVGIKAQVGGVLTKVHFKEGQDVNRGDILFTIDPRPYEAALKQAEANLARSRAQFENAKAEEKRYAELVRKGYVSQTQYDQVRTASEALEATTQADRALLDNAKLNLQYCTIRAPFSGRTGSLVVDEGNLIKAIADTPMVTINQIRPVHVGFSIPEKDLASVKKYMSKGVIKVEAYAPQDEKDTVTGKLSFIENSVDVSTGTIKLKGLFENRDRKLWPGQFVNIVLTLSIQKDALVVESRAVQTGQKGAFVFVLKDDSTVEARQVDLGRAYGLETVIEGGLKAGEKVVTDGQVRLSPGAKVEVKSDGNGAESKGSVTGAKESEKKSSVQNIKSDGESGKRAK